MFVFLKHAVFPCRVRRSFERFKIRQRLYGIKITKAIVEKMKYLKTIDEFYIDDRIKNLCRLINVVEFLT